MVNRIGIVGFGDVGACFSQAMTRAGATVSAYDVLLDDSDQAEESRERMSKAGAKSVSLPLLLEESDYVLSTVTTRTAEEVARTCARFLRPGQVYVDLNSTSPSAKVLLAEIVGSSPAAFVEGAILGAIGATGSKTRILLGGRGAAEAAEVFARFGLNAAAYSAEIGKASTFKMLRSIFSKGLENLILELLIAGKRAGIDRDLWEDVTGFMAGTPFDKIASNWVRTHANACDRRYYEMVQVLETMREIGVEPVMTEATTRFFERSLSLGLKEAFRERPDTHQNVIDFMESRLARIEDR